MAALHIFEGETLEGLSVPLTFPPGAPGRPEPCVRVSEGFEGKPWAVLRNGEMICRGRD